MKNSVLINHQLKPFNKKILVGGDTVISKPLKIRNVESEIANSFNKIKNKNKKLKIGR